jgi:hypothetical protein
VLNSRKSLQKKDKEELITMLLAYEGDAIRKMSKALDKQLDSIATQMDSLDIDITKDADQALLDLVIKFGKEGKKVAESLAYMTEGEEKDEAADEFNFEDLLVEYGPR